MSGNYGQADVVRALSAAEISKLTNPQLKIALATLLNDENTAVTGPSNADLMIKLNTIELSLKEIPALKKENARLSKELADLTEITRNQQLFLESRDRIDRQRNLIIRGVSEDADDLGADDATKVASVLRAAACDIDVSGIPVKRLGQPNDRKRRPLLLILRNGADRDAIVSSGRKLKEGANVGTPYAKVYLKKDVHPAVRKEHARLHEREEEEKKKPCNIGINIVYDWKQRVLLRDDVVIDRFFPKFF